MSKSAKAVLAVTTIFVVNWSGDSSEGNIVSLGFERVSLPSAVICFMRIARQSEMFTGRVFSSGCTTKSNRTKPHPASIAPELNKDPVRSPGSYSNSQWEVALLHMRVRANLTAEEHKDILAFMKSAH